MNNLILTLIGTEYCHLCEAAEQMINNLFIDTSHSLQSINYHKLDIMNDNNMYDQYSLHIPVILIMHNHRTAELKWPFNQNDIELNIDNFLSN